MRKIHRRWIWFIFTQTMLYCFCGIKTISTICYQIIVSGAVFFFTHTEILWHVNTVVSTGSVKRSSTHKMITMRSPATYTPIDTQQLSNQKLWSEGSMLTILTFGHPAQCVSPHCHGSATHSPGPWSSSGASQETGWCPWAQSAPLHTELEEQRRGDTVRWGCGQRHREDNDQKLEK